MSYGYIASLGDHDISVEEGTEQHIPVANSFVHSPYRSPLHSLGLVLLASPARFNQYVRPISLPSRCTQVGERCSVSGWGPTIPNQSEFDLKWASASHRHVSTSEVSKYWSKASAPVHDPVSKYILGCFRIRILY